ncbi:BatA domain-containing protein, partial [Paracoccus sanguinis]|uniref:BatA domain-containing protein n=1 Tax=Paracoccus sanguinis TaxID=1545044 RepID=UPI00051FF31B
MMMLGPLGFAAPWLLAAGLALPVLWWMLRAVPPRPREVSFPGTALLAGLADPAPVARRTPWWLLALRLAAVAAVILALAGPVWRPAAPVAGEGPLLILVDAGWGAAPGWEGAQSRART